MTMNAIIGNLISGFAMKAYAAVAVLYAGNKAWAYVSDVFAAAQTGIAL